MRLKKSFLTPAIVGLIAVASGGWLLQQGQDQGNVYLKATILRDAIRTISDRYVDPVDPAKLYDMAVDGMIERLGDPHTSLLRPEDYADLKLQTTGNYGGLGIRIQKRGDWVTVVSTLPNTPAERAGMRPGDRIVEVDGKSARGWSDEDAVQVLRGPKGSGVDLKVMRLGVSEPIPFRIVRDEIHVAYSTGFMYEPGIAYIQLRQFSERSADDIHAIMDSLSQQGVKGLILDLRSDPGGLLEEGVAVSDLFLKRSDEVVETRSRLADQNHTYYASHAPVDPGEPMVVLVDAYTASAAEIVAGALQDHDRALVLGEPTYGKGSVQTLYQLPAGNYLKLTTAKWYTPSGRSIQREHEGPHPVAMADDDTSTAVASEPVSASADTSQAQVYYTDNGRKVFGGGGITPDLIVEPDTLTSVERQFRKALGDKISTYSDALFRFAVEYSNEHKDLKPDFEVTPAMLDGLYQKLQSAGVDLPRDLYDGAKRLVAREIGIQVATIAFDEEVSTRRRLVLDRQVEVAADLLKQGRSQSQLFALAARQAESQK